ncbi:ABC transporter substrate-binding protein [Streptomyces sp. NBC_01304]|uniref:ABC transporter substrate-binding protein n=1 Tax=Streptomyces sp. NBC_01304 TaxID=2903818 RepID=UPI002E120370|nr:ABC transporter substrate-binding protein [Streptomyces sp. NBC_01304]
MNWSTRASVFTLAGLMTMTAGCGTLAGDADKPRIIVVGTTDTLDSLDPTASYDTGTWTLLSAATQSLLTYKRGSQEPTADAAESCTWVGLGNVTYRCTLRTGLTFSSGQDVTAKDVKYSIDRVRTMEHPLGPSSLLASIKDITTKGSDVTFHLKRGDATFPFALATPAAAIVDHRDYPAKKARPTRKITGSGPYVLSEYRAGSEAVLTANPDYRGPESLQNDEVRVRYFKNNDQMLAALKAGTIDVVHRGLTQDQISDLQARDDTKSGIKVLEMRGQEVRALILNTRAPNLEKAGVRRAMAHLIDRGELAGTVYAGTVEPLYSTVPAGIDGHTTAFFDQYSEVDIDKARTELAAADVTTPVPLTLTYTSGHYGPTTRTEFAVLKKQLEAGGLFDVDVKAVDNWQDYQEKASHGAYEAFGLGWYPDFPDADNFIGPFVGKDNPMYVPYGPKSVLDTLARSRLSANRTDAASALEGVQHTMARDVPLIPLWQGNQYIVAQSLIGGTEWAYSPNSLLRLWELKHIA